jgi:hypothetical protein
MADRWSVAIDQFDVFGITKIPVGVLALKKCVKDDILFRHDGMLPTWKKHLSEVAFHEPVRYALVESWARSAKTLLSRKGAPKFKRVDEAILGLRQRKCRI